MTVIVDLIASYAKWIYVFCAIGVLLYVRGVWSAWRERRRALFTLEREVAGERALRSFFMVLVFVLAAVMLYTAQTYVLPRLPQPARAAEPSPTALLMAVPTGSPTPTLPPTQTPPPPTTSARATATRSRPAVTPSPSPTQNPPTAAPAPPPRCPNAGARIIFPGVGSKLSGIVPIRGSAYAPDFQFYKVEVGIAPNPQHWSSISDVHRNQVSDNTLDVLNTDALPAGNYILKLTVVDVTGNYPLQNVCEVPVTIVH